MGAALPCVSLAPQTHAFEGWAHREQHYLFGLGKVCHCRGRFAVLRAQAVPSVKQTRSPLAWLLLQHRTRWRAAMPPATMKRTEPLKV